MKTSLFAKKTCQSIPKECQTKNIHTTDKDPLKEDFINFKNLMINEFESMKYSFYKEVNSFKKQLWEKSEFDPTRTQSQTDNICISSVLERLINQLQDQVSTLKYQLDRKDKVINTLLKKTEKKASWRNFLFPSYKKCFKCWSNFMHYSSYLYKKTA